MGVGGRVKWCRVPMCGDDQVLETDSGCTTLGMYLILLGCTLKNGYNGKSYVISIPQ